MKTIFQCLLLFVSAILPLRAQTIYVTSVTNVPLGNYTHAPQLGNCDTTTIFTCIPTNDTLQYFQNTYSDIAVDQNQNIYHVSSWGSLYRRSLADSTTCQYLGSFPDQSINSLVSDSNGTIYGAGTTAGQGRLYSYSNGSFATLGSFPPGIFPAGDLFFYENRLFMTATDAFLMTSSLVEVSLPDPQQSCIYMGLLNLQPYGAFAIRDGSNTRAYLFTTNSSSTSSLIEIDIPSRTIFGNLICNLPYLVSGADVYYDRTTTTNSCHLTAVTAAEQIRLDLRNPASGRLRLVTDIAADQLRRCEIQTIAGQVAKTYPADEFPDQLDLDGLPPGLYILLLETVDGRALARKVVVE